MTLYVGDPVKMVDRYASRRPCTCKASQPSSFDGMTGRVVSVSPLMIQLDGERLPMRFDERDFVRLNVDASSPNLTGAE